MVLQALLWSIWITDEQISFWFLVFPSKILDWPAATAVSNASAFELDKKHANIDHDIAGHLSSLPWVWNLHAPTNHSSPTKWCSTVHHSELILRLPIILDEYYQLYFGVLGLFWLETTGIILFSWWCMMSDLCHWDANALKALLWLLEIILTISFLSGNG